MAARSVLQRTLRPTRLRSYIYSGRDLIYHYNSDLRIEEDFDKREAKLIALADALGWKVFRVVVENDLIPGRDGKVRPASAFKRRKIPTPSGKVELRVVRPGFREVLDDITTGRVNGLLAEDLDRTVRDPRDLEDLLDACAMTSASARSLSGSLTLTNGGNEAERSMARVMVAMANKASADTARRVADGRERNWGESYQGGPRPFGFVAATDTDKHHRTLLIVPDEAEIIRNAAADILDRDISLKAILRELRENNVPTSRNGQWDGRTLKQVLTKPAVAGLAVHKGKLKPAPWPAILERDVWERLCEKLNNPPADANRGNEPKHLLTGIAKCGICNDGTTVRANGSGTLRGKQGYQCEKIAHIHRNIEHVDAMVEEAIIRYLDRLRQGRPEAADSKGHRRARASRRSQKASGTQSGANPHACTRRSHRRRKIPAAGAPLVHVRPLGAERGVVAVPGIHPGRVRERAEQAFGHVGEQRA